jgi:hypothetical protein
VFTVCGRRVKLSTGAKTQTVNICTPAGVHGEYEYVIRFHRPDAVTEPYLGRQRPGSVPEFVKFLIDVCGGDLEQSPHQHERVEMKAAKAHRPPSEWEIAARDATESAINQLVLEFVERPYLHRVEHSIHCRLFQLMAAQPAFHGQLSFGKWTTQAIHKEWPEYVVRPEKGNRRGAFDLVVLSPDAVRNASLRQFRDGVIRPSIVIEMGLDYGYSHLSGDVRKLRNSGIGYSYLVHLARQNVPGDFAAIERLLGECGFESAYVRHTGTRARYKLVGDGRMHEKSLP